MLALSAFACSASAAVHTVQFEADTPMWTVGLNIAYPDMNITLGDTLKFVSYAFHDVTLVHADGAPTWSKCSMNGIAANQTTIYGVSEFAGTGVVEKHYTPPTCGEYFIACSIMMHCAMGQRFKLTVASSDGNECTSPCVRDACVTADSKKAVTDDTNMHPVKPAAPAMFWGEGPYADLTANIGDAIVFHTFGGMYDVATVSSADAFNSCDLSGKTLHADWKMVQMKPSTEPTDACVSNADCCKNSSCGSSGNGPMKAATFTFTAAAAGDVYLVSSKDAMSGGPQCKLGQKFKLTVLEAGLANSGFTSEAPMVATTTTAASDASDSVASWFAVMLVACNAFFRGL